MRKCGEVLGEVWESVWGCREDKGKCKERREVCWGVMGKGKGGVGKCWGRCVGCGNWGKCEKLCWGVGKVREDVGRGVGKCVRGVKKCWGRCGGCEKVCWGVGKCGVLG